MRLQIILMTVGFILFGLVAAILFAGNFTNPIQRAVDVLKIISEGDLTKRLEVESLDEIGSMAGYFNQVVEKLESIIGDIAGNANILAALLRPSSRRSARKRRRVCSPLRAKHRPWQLRPRNERQHHFRGRRHGAGHHELHSVATATEEMTATIGEIAANSEKARAITAKRRRTPPRCPR